MHDSPDVTLEDLIADGRHAEALALVDDALDGAPDDADLHALRALCLILLDDGTAASAAATQATQLDPSSWFGFWLLGEALAVQGEWDAALRAAARAAQLAPDEADPWALRARVHARRSAWGEARDAADAALQRDPAHGDALALRALATDQLEGRAAGEAAWRTLAERLPASAFARSGRGWALLEAGDRAAAEEEFEQALALDPTAEWAREGLVASIKARSPVYGLLLRYLLWMRRLPRQTRFAVVFGGWLGYRLLARVAKETPTVAPVLYVVIGVYLAFVLLTWLGDPVFDLLLWLRRDTRRLVSRDRARGALLMAACLAAAAATGLAAVTVDGSLFLAAAAFALTTLPAASVYQCDAGWPRTTLGACVALLIGASALSAVLPAPYGVTAGTVALLGAVLAIWLSLWLTTVDVEVRRTA